MILVTGATGHEGALSQQVAAKPNKSRFMYMIAGHRALGFGEIAAAVQSVAPHSGAS